MNQPFNLDRIRQCSAVGRLHFAHEMTSTSDVCKTLLSESRECFPAESQQLPLLVLTQQQTSGRGQLNRKWWSPAGALMFTWARKCSPENASDGLTSLAAACSVAEAIESISPPVAVAIKWPNDVFIGRKKIAGILIESVPFEDQRVQLIGIGINSNNSMTSAPEEISNASTSLCDETKKNVDLQNLLLKTIDRLHHNLVGTDNTARKSLLENCVRRSVCGPGTPVSVETPQGTLKGLFDSFDDSGHLLVDIQGQVKAIASGSLRW